MAEIPVSPTPGYAAHRPLVPGRHGMVAAAHPLAAAAGARILQRGGSAVDAAVAVAAALNVVEPQMSGLLGIGWLLYHEAATGRGHVLNYSGCAPAAARPELFDDKNRWSGILAPVVPGALAGWHEAHRRFGRLPWPDLFADAVAIADEGFPASRHLVALIGFSAERKFGPWPSSRRVYLPAGRVPRPGEPIVQADLAATLRTVAAAGPDALAHGDLGRRVVDFCRAHGGLLSGEDLASYAPAWEEPIATTYRGRTVRTVPPNASAFQVLATLNLLEGFDLGRLAPNGADFLHLHFEAAKLATADRIAHGADPRARAVPLAALLSREFADRRRAAIRLDHALLSAGERWNPNPPADAVAPAPLPTPLPPGEAWGLTTHFSVVDDQGNVASVTQTNGLIFGSGVVIEGTGLVLNNGLYWFETDPRSPNQVAAGRRFEMPLAPVQVLADGKPVFTLGTPGSFGIPHTTVQVLSHLLDFGSDLPEAIEAPRGRTLGGVEAEVEDRVPPGVRAELERRGHRLKLLTAFSMEVGGVQGIALDPATGMRFGGADPRR
ncbi:MAG: gamma-glutamyltransferase family protein, partial [Planctomycetes bacterium]|nr:gamma-glutamyltransferase family protein [Planctomycetota bacterium]